MEDKRLKRVFDQVKLSPEREEAMLADLLNEKKEVSGMKQINSKRRIPAAVLVAAVLVIALAGTALAAEYFGWLEWVRPIEPGEFLDDSAQAGYRTAAVYDKIPAESLTPEALAWITSVPGDGERNYDTRTFDTWQEVENFLGLELADNALLEGMGTKNGASGSGVIGSLLPCQVTSEGLAGLTEVQSSHQDGEYTIMQTALLQIAGPGQEDCPAALTTRLESWGSLQAEAYQTPGGLEAVYFVEESGGDVNVFATFPQGGTLFIMCVQGGSVEGGIEEMKLVLDAYE